VGGRTSSVTFWMASIAMDKNGDIALGYRKMESPKLIITGTGVQTSSFNRWGDYSGMAIDPADDCTFWYTQEYYKTTGIANWNTHVTSFKFTTCH
jgi:hypothetical protein